MSISGDLKELAHKIEQDADPLLEKTEHDKELFSIVAQVVATATSFIERSADILEEHLGGEKDGITAEKLVEMAKLAEAFDESGDPLLVRTASVIDEILLTIGAPKNAVAEAIAIKEAQLDALREKYREKAREELYRERRKELDENNKKAKIQKAVNDQVKEYRPLEAPLQSRYCPDHTGVPMTRIADRVYQCDLDHKLYNYEAGYTTDHGDKVPGGGVQTQTPDWGELDSGHTVFDTRATLMSRYASVADEKDIHRARALLAYMKPEDAAKQLIENGMAQEQAFLAVKAAQVMDEGPEKEDDTKSAKDNFYSLFESPEEAEAFEGRILEHPYVMAPEVLRPIYEGEEPGDDYWRYLSGLREEYPEL